MWKCRYTIPSLMDWWLKYFAREITINCFATGHQHCFGFDWSGEILYLSVISWSIGLHPGTVPRLGSFDHSRNEPSWLLWHWSSRGQLALCNGRVSYTFNWQSENQCQRINAKWILFLSHAKKANKIFASRRFVLDDRNDCLLFWCTRSGQCDWILRDWSGAWPTLTWLAEWVDVAISSSVRNTNFPDNLKPWSGHGVG